MPKLWTDTVEAHRRQVREAIMGTTWDLVTERGLTSVSMSQIAEATGIGRATLYKYFANVEAILAAWHERHVLGHLDQLKALRDQASDPGVRLQSVLRAYALIVQRRGYHGAEIAALLHRGEQVARAQRRLTDMFRELIVDAVKAGDVRDDIAPGELASYCLHAMAAADGTRSRAAVDRLIAIMLAGLQPPDHAPAWRSSEPPTPPKPVTRAHELADGGPSAPTSRPRGVGGAC